MLNYLEEIGELDNTIVIVTSDNGMAFPSAKANAYDFGIHVPLAIRLPELFSGGRNIDIPVSFADLAPTILELTGTSSDGMLPISGESFLHLMKASEQSDTDSEKRYVFAGRERHSSSRYLNRGYPQRIIRSKEFLLIWNMKPERWPAGAPQRVIPGTEGELWPMHGIDEDGLHHSEWAYTDIDEAPTKSFIIENRQMEEYAQFFEIAVGKRPEFELFELETDPFCMVNLAGDSAYTEVEEEMKRVLLNELEQSGDPRIVGPDKEVFDSYIRYSRMREFPDPGH
jgi:uncharacterized sulfatase